MMSPALLLAASLLLDAMPAPRNAVEVIASGGRVTVRAERLPLSQLLDRIAQKTGMKVTYDGTRPSTLVSLDVEGVSEVEAILKLMEGLGISYVFKTDATGEAVDSLIVSGPGAGTLVAAASPSGHVDPPPEEPVEEYGRIPLDPAVVEASGGAGPPNLNNPYMGLPPQHFPQAALPVPSEAGPPVPEPKFPGAASFPTR
jgi:hypothetical protein